MYLYCKKNDLIIYCIAQNIYSTECREYENNIITILLPFFTPVVKNI